MFLFITNNHLFYSIPLLVMFPKYTCPDAIAPCDAEARCHYGPSIVKIDWSDEWSLDNWVDKYGLDCVEPWRIALMGSMYFAGTTTFGIIVSRLGDLYGRKWPVTISALISIPIHGMLLYSNNINFTSVLFFILGALGPGKC
jgi:MFS family permease